MYEMIVSMIYQYIMKSSLVSIKFYQNTNILFDMNIYQYRYLGNQGL